MVTHPVEVAAKLKRHLQYYLGCPLAAIVKEVGMDGNTSQPLWVYDESENKVVAQVVLNAYNIEGAGPLGEQRGVIRSFKIEKGNLVEHWNNHQSFTLRDERGDFARARIAAFPVEQAAYGLLEFI